MIHFTFTNCQTSVVATRFKIKKVKTIFFMILLIQVKIKKVKTIFFMILLIQDGTLSIYMLLWTVHFQKCTFYDI